ncbi:hypothetical protein FA95DRAFT_1529805 [Auriscalpium vulgare]|uniref:Uncharacterized protein n=1 Tax=Auriscalpium vulgare TaxID=40419 RepID=A0ACB8SDN5_9AGAM|nr:hypothetical protein FA95DRAFT_1529805 [Auriscalpium vulgare]
MPLPSAETGYFFIASALLLFVLGAYTLLFSAFLPPSGIRILDIMITDVHYKSFALLIIPTTSYFVIANWVGWQYFMNS